MTIGIFLGNKTCFPVCIDLVIATSVRLTETLAAKFFSRCVPFVMCGSVLIIWFAFSVRLLKSTRLRTCGSDSQMDVETDFGART